MGKTIMISSHILSELEEICDHLGIIERGRLVFSGTLEDIRKRMGASNRLAVKVTGDLAAAAQLLSALPQVAQAAASGDQIQVTLQDGQPGDGLIARTLIQGGFDLLALVPEQVKLDDAFLELTKGLVH
jgi:ABC-2 type transport system ATP-binding protein